MSNLLVSLYVFLRIWIFYFIFVLISNKGKENHLRNNELRCVKQEGIWTLQPGAIDMYIILYNEHGQNTRTSNVPATPG